MSRIIRRATTAVARAVLNHCVRRIDGEIATTRAHIATVEQDLERQLPPEIRADLARERDQLEARLEGYLEELAYVEAKRGQLDERAGCCPCAFSEQNAGA